MIQGSVGGGDNTSLVLKVNEINRNHWFWTLIKFAARFKDDIILIPKNPNCIRTKKDVKHKLLNKLYPGYEFEIEFNRSTNAATICDIEISIDPKSLKLSTKTLDDPDKVRSFVLKSSNIKQDINGIFKCLQERYIIINDSEDKYIKTKSKICYVLINGEWTPYDIRKCQHLKWDQRNNFIDKYLKNKSLKYSKYRNMKKLTLLNKNWWKDENEDKKEQINLYMTYQKTMVDENRMKAIIHSSLKLLPSEIQNKMDLNLYYKYQKPLKRLIGLN